MDQAQTSERACQMSVAVVDQNAVPRLNQERFIMHEKFDWLYSSAGVGEVARHRKVTVDNLLWV